MLSTTHRRFNPLTEEWVLVSPHRSKRPWLGQMEKKTSDSLPAYDPDCYLCPGNERAGGVRNDQYTGTFVFNNDFASLLPDSPGQERSLVYPLMRAEPESGICRVVCFSPRHDLTLPELALSDIQNVISTWTRESFDLAARDDIAYVQVFENKGAVMGCSNPHPHSQIWSQSRIPNEPEKELSAQKAFYSEHKHALLHEYLEEEHRQKDRLVAVNDHFTALVPFWAIWPFEILLVAHGSAAKLDDLSASEVEALADIMKRVTTRYDNLFETSFPYSMGFHQSPTDGQKHPEWVLHAHFYPPLLRSATVKKFMVGYELLAMPQRDITPEVAAERLREFSDTVHYRSAL
ncbi:MAG TPA: UDP-glucose--hexose-1-phosphate uridylyltransferase [Leptolinea sp.]